jgi:hypothetical protein
MRRALSTLVAALLALSAWLLIVGAPTLALATASEQRSGWTCIPEGRECTFGSDCCSKKCVSDPKLGKVCKPGS